MDLIDFITGISAFPWWFWAMFAGAAFLMVSFVLTSWPLAGLGVVFVVVGAVGALWRRS